MEQKDLEISEKNATIKGYLDKIVSFCCNAILSRVSKSDMFPLLHLIVIVKVNLTDNAVEREARLNESEAELARSRAACTRLSQVI